MIARVLDDDELREDNEELNEEDNDYIETPELDQFDLNLLNIQAVALSMMIYGYVLEYISTLQGMEVIRRKYAENNEGIEPDPDITALEAAKFQLIAQAILVGISTIQYKNTLLHYRSNNLNAARSANFELLLADVIEEIAYALNYIGTKKIFALNHDEPILGG